MIIFQDMHGDVPQCTLETSTSKPLVGNNFNITSTTIREYGKTLMFEPIPLEFMYTDAQKP